MQFGFSHRAGLKTGPRSPAARPGRFAVGTVRFSFAWLRGPNQGSNEPEGRTWRRFAEPRFGGPRDGRADPGSPAVPRRGRAQRVWHHGAVRGRGCSGDPRGMGDRGRGAGGAAPGRHCPGAACADSSVLRHHHHPPTSTSSRVTSSAH